MNPQQEAPPSTGNRVKLSDYRVTTDRSAIDFDYVHRYLSTESYWAQKLDAARLRRAIEHSLCFSLFNQQVQVGFARVITDHATFGYLSDVFIDATERGKGLGKLLVREILAHPELQALRRWCLCTKDAHGLYAQHGFSAPQNPEHYMEIIDPGIYEREAQARDSSSEQNLTNKATP